MPRGAGADWCHCFPPATHTAVDTLESPRAWVDLDAPCGGMVQVCVLPHPPHSAGYTRVPSSLGGPRGATDASWGHGASVCSTSPLHTTADTPNSLLPSVLGRLCGDRDTLMGDGPNGCSPSSPTQRHIRPGSLGFGPTMCGYGRPAGAWCRRLQSLTLPNSNRYTQVSSALGGSCGAVTSPWGDGAGVCTPLPPFLAHSGGYSRVPSIMHGPCGDRDAPLEEIAGWCSPSPPTQRRIHLGPLGSRWTLLIG